MTSKLKINVKSIKKQENSLNIQFNVNVGLYLFGVVKIFGISLKEDAIHFLFFRFPSNFMKMDQESVKILRNIPFFNLLKLRSFRLEEFHLDLKIGTEDVIVTVFSVFAISTILSILSARNARQIHTKNYDYKITPIYNANLLSFQVSAKMSIKIFQIIKILSFMKKHQKNKELNKFSSPKVPVKI